MHFKGRPVPVLCSYIISMLEAPKILLIKTRLNRRVPRTKEPEKALQKITRSSVLLIVHNV
jgi:hypothetical protein